MSNENERSMILQWIEQQGKTNSSMMREYLNVSDLCLEETSNNSSRVDRSDSITSSLQHSRLSVATLPMIQSGKFSLKQKSSYKDHLKQIFIAILIVIPVIIGSLIFVIFLRQNSISSLFSHSPVRINDSIPLLIYRLPNNCTYSRIFPLFSWTNLPSFNYTYHSKIFKAMSNQAMLTFALRHDPFYWCIDTISIRDISTNRELMKNGDFESFPSTSFIRCRSVTSSSTTSFSTSLHPQSGNQSFCDGTVGTASYLSQRIEMEIGRMYHFSFWLRNLGDMPNNAFVFISYD